MLPACVRTKAQTIVITGRKNVLQKGPETEKKIGIEPTAEVVTTVCLSGFGRNVATTVVSTPGSAFNAP